MNPLFGCVHRRGSSPFLNINVWGEMDHPAPRSPSRPLLMLKLDWIYALSWAHCVHNLSPRYKCCMCSCVCVRMPVCSHHWQQSRIFCDITYFLAIIFKYFYNCQYFEYLAAKSVIYVMWAYTYTRTFVYMYTYVSRHFVGTLCLYMQTLCINTERLYISILLFA